MRCGRCGNENDAANRFCGMCGAALVATTPPAGRAQAAAAPTESIAAPKAAAVPSPPVPAHPAPRQSEESTIPEPARFRRANVEPRSAPLRTEIRTNEIRTGEVRTGEIRTPDGRPSAGPVITGHSFLGLSTPGPAVDHNPHSDALRPSSNVDYLLDDEEEPKRGWGKLVLIVLALALAVGLGYLHFKQAGFDGLIAGDKKPAATKPTPNAEQNPDSGAPTGPTTSNGAIPAAGAGDNGTAPAPVNGAVTAAQPAAQAPAQSAPSQAAPSTSPPGPASQTLSGSAQAVPDASQTSTASAPAQAVGSQPQPTTSNSPAAAPPAAAGPDDRQAPRPEAPPAPKAAVPAPAMAKPPAAKPIDPVTNAERYIYGRGVREDCDHGLRLLKQAADQSNAKAMISMARCTRREPARLGTCPRPIGGLRWLSTKSPIIRRCRTTCRNCGAR